MKLSSIMVILVLLVAIVTAAFAEGGPAPAPACCAKMAQANGYTPQGAKAAFAAKCRALRHQRRLAGVHGQYFRMKRAFIAKAMGLTKDEIVHKGIRQDERSQ